MPLTDVAVRNAKPSVKPTKLTDGGGLYLLLKPNGAKWWRLDYRFAGKRKTLSMGVYPEVGLKVARDMGYFLIPPLTTTHGFSLRLSRKHWQHLLEPSLKL